MPFRFLILGLLLLPCAVVASAQQRIVEPAGSVPNSTSQLLGSQAAEAKPAVKLGILYWSMKIPGQVAMRKGLERELAAINKEIAQRKGTAIQTVVRVAGDGKKGIERQIRQMNELVDLGVDFIIVQPTDSAALVKPLSRANAKEIPVVAYDQYISKGRLASFLTSDNFMAGYLDGEFLASSFDDKKKIRLILVEYPRVSSTVERVNGFLKALDDARQPYRIMATYPAVEPVGGAKAGKAILKDFPRKNSVDAVFSVNDGGGLAVVDALFKAGRTEIIHLTIDGDAKSVANIVADRLTQIDCAQFCGQLGRETMKVTWRLIRGQKVPKVVLVPVFPITAKTRPLFKGWNEPPPAKFKKPWKSKNPLWVYKLKNK